MILAFVIEPFGHGFFDNEGKQDGYTHKFLRPQDNWWRVWRPTAKMASNRNALTSAIVQGQLGEDPLQLQYSRNFPMLIIDLAGRYFWWTFLHAFCSFFSSNTWSGERYLKHPIRPHGLQDIARSCLHCRCGRSEFCDWWCNLLPWVDVQSSHASEAKWYDGHYGGGWHLHHWRLHQWSRV